MNQGRLAGHFLEGARGPIFVVRHGPERARACVLVFPPFAEEMNKCRRMVALAAMRLAERGVATVIPDLYGTGDSGGDFCNADWNGWVGDLVQTARWSAEAIGPVTGLLGVRLGCLLACDDRVMAALPGIVGSVLWQPVFDGRRHLAQFLRLRVAASLANDVKESVSGLRSTMSAQGEVEVAGYRLSNRLATELESVPPPERLPEGFGSVDWFEVVRGSVGTISPPSLALVQSSCAAGLPIRDHVLAGDPFWASTEVVVNEALVRDTCDALFRDDASPFRGGM